MNSRLSLACASTRSSSLVSREADSVLRFWLGDDYLTTPKNDALPEKRKIWFSQSSDFDEICKEKFSGLLLDAAHGKLDSWRQGYQGLAAVILMDQFSRNVYRNTRSMYALDSKCLDLAKDIHDDGSASEFPPIQRVWLYLPLMHSERLDDQELCVKRYETLLAEAKLLPGSETLQASLQHNIDYGIKHLKVVEQWSRFPHRNKILGREDTDEEKRAFKEGTIASF